MWYFDTNPVTVPLYLWDINPAPIWCETVRILYILQAENAHFPVEPCIRIQVVILTVLLCGRTNLEKLNWVSADAIPVPAFASQTFWKDILLWFSACELGNPNLTIPVPTFIFSSNHISKSMQLRFKNDSNINSVLWQIHLSRLPTTCSTFSTGICILKAKMALY